jgi:ribosomal protein S27E
MQKTLERARLETEVTEEEAEELELEKQMKQKKAEDLVRAGRFEEAAQQYERLGDLDKAGECRRMNRTTYVISANIHVGKNGAINISCPHCGASQPITSKETNEVTCAYCGKRYVIPEKILKLL